MHHDLQSHAVLLRGQHNRFRHGNVGPADGDGGARRLGGRKPLPVSVTRPDGVGAGRVHREPLARAGNAKVGDHIAVVVRDGHLHLIGGVVALRRDVPHHRAVTGDFIVAGHAQPGHGGNDDRGGEEKDRGA